MPRSEVELMADILSRYDQDGNLREMVAGFEALIGNPLGRLILSLTPVKVPQVRDLLEQQRRLLLSGARSVLLFAPRGWAPCGLTPQSMIKKALDVYDRAGSIDEAEAVLVEGWNESAISLRFLKETFANWQKRDLGDVVLDYLYLDGTYFRMHESSARAEPLFCAWGITRDGKKVLVGLSVGSAESYEAWKVFLRDLAKRNLASPLLGISDGAAGLIKAFEEVFARSLRQRCLVHKLRNVLSAVSAEGQAEVKQAYWRIFDDIKVSPGESAVQVAKDRASTFQTAYATVYPTAVRMVMDDIESLTAFLNFPVEHWLRVRHTNLLERTFGESRRRVKVIGRLPGEESCISLVWAVLDRGSTGWRGLRQTVAGLRLLDELRDRLLKQPPDRADWRTPTRHRFSGLNTMNPRRLHPPARLHRS